MTKRKRTITIVSLMVAALLIIAGVAWAAGTFPDVSAEDVHYDAIEWAAENGIVNGYANGNFGPYDNITRGQAATMFMNNAEYLTGEAEAALEEALTAPMDPLNRGCPACHVTTLPGDPTRGDAPMYSLKWEAMGPDSTSTQFALHGTLSNTAGVTVCLGCHSAGNAEQNGNAAPISLRAIVHPAHLFSGIFLAHYRGNCFSCHEIVNNGEYYILTEAVETNDKGIPEELPIPGMQEPSGPEE
jgi:cytochrome c5